MPAIALLIVLLSIGILFAYGLRTTRARLAEYTEDRAVARAVAMANAVEDSGPGGLGEALKLANETGGGKVILVNRDGEITAREGERGPPEFPDRLIEAAAGGRRLTEMIAHRRVASIPVIREGEVRGGVVFMSSRGETQVITIFSRSNLEAAALASVVGGGLMLLVEALLSRRVEER